MNKSDSDFEDELLKIQDALDRYAYMLTQNKDDANDLSQETMLKALINRDKYISSTNIKGWVFTIMKNIFRNKSHRDSRFYSLEDNQEGQYILELSQESIFDSFNRDCTLKDINQAISSFPAYYQIPFSMFSAGFKYEEIALFMNIPIGTVKSRIYYMRKKLQILLEDYREDL